MTSQSKLNTVFAVQWVVRHQILESVIMPNRILAYWKRKQMLLSGRYNEGIIKIKEIQ